MIYHGRVLTRLPDSVVLGEYILLRQRGVFYGTRINYNNQSISLYRPVFTGAFKNQGEIILFIDKSGIVYQFNPLIGQSNLSAWLNTPRSICGSKDSCNDICTNNCLANSPWIISRFTGINDDGHEIYYFNEGRIERKVPMTTLFINRSTNVSLIRQALDLPLEVHIDRITVLNQSQLQIPRNCADTMSIPIEISSFINGSSSVLIYSFYENNQKIVVNHTVSKVLLDDIHYIPVESSVSFNNVNFLNGWIVDFPNATYVEPTYWQQGEYISRANGTYNAVFRLNNVQATIGSVITLNIQVNTVNEFTQTFTLQTSGSNMIMTATINLSAEASLRFGYTSNNELPTFNSGSITITPRF